MTEFQLTVAVKEYLEAALPQDIYWTHVPLGEVRDKRTAAKLKHMGTRPGCSDFLVFTNPLLCIELKAGKNRLSEHQVEFSRQVEDQGHYFVVARSIEDVADALRGVLGDKVRAQL